MSAGSIGEEGAQARTAAEALARGGGGESNHGGVHRPVAHHCLSAMAAGPTQPSGTVARGGENTNKPHGAWHTVGDEIEEKQWKVPAGKLSFISSAK